MLATWYTVVESYGRPSAPHPLGIVTLFVGAACKRIISEFFAKDMNLCAFGRAAGSPSHGTWESFKGVGCESVLTKAFYCITLDFQGSNS